MHATTAVEQSAAREAYRAKLPGVAGGYARVRQAAVELPGDNLVKEEGRRGCGDVVDGERSEGERDRIGYVDAGKPARGGPEDAADGLVLKVFVDVVLVVGGEPDLARRVREAGSVSGPTGGEPKHLWQRAFGQPYQAREEAAPLVTGVHDERGVSPLGATRRSPWRL